MRDVDVHFVSLVARCRYVAMARRGLHRSAAGQSEGGRTLKSYRAMRRLAGIDVSAGASILYAFTMPILTLNRGLREAVGQARRLKLLRWSRDRDPLYASVPYRNVGTVITDKNLRCHGLRHAT